MEKSKKHLSDRVPVYAFIWAGSYIGSLGAMKTLELSPAVGIMLTLVPAIAFALFLYKFYRSVYFMDEVQIKIQMEAVVMAFALALFTIMTLGLIDLAVELKPEDWSYRFLVPLFVAYYFIGLFISKRKYHIDHEEHD